VIARSYADAPEIDGTVIVSGARQARVGDVLEVRVTRAGTHDLWARAA
jgi:ribosomal protein S12 methylthiotransferase